MENLAPTIGATCHHQRGSRIASSPMDIEGLLQALPAHVGCEENFQDEVMAMISQRVDARTTDLRALRLSLQELSHQDALFLSVSEMMAVWMTESGNPSGRSEGIELLRWLSGEGLLSARVNYACAVISDPTRRKDHAQAFSVLQTLQDQPDMPAELESEVYFALGTCYLEGSGVERDAFSSADFLYRSWKAGNSKAAYNLGLLFSFYASQCGLGGRPNFRLAAYYLTQAAEHGQVRAMCDLAQMHLLSLAPGATEDQGIRLLRRAYAEGSSQAGSTLASMEQAIGMAMTQEEWEQVEVRAIRQASDTARALHHCGFTTDPTYWLRNPCAEAVRDEVSAMQITTLLVRARARGYLALDHEFEQQLARLATPASRQALANDSSFWRRLNVRP